MCWSGISFNHCYDCAREFNYRAHVMPCYANQNGKPCARRPLKQPVVQTSENCSECQSAQSAEEECQPTAYRLKPLNLDIKGKERMTALYSSYQ
ncbi:hypothetical protein HD806DRAFT_505431 [Xylariaceae sp. AK1471]|nr:hypothetical protein HD806DRAFT_505431 [Xylariaceae sp. AK1471]